MSGCDGVKLLSIDCLDTLKIQVTPTIVDGVNCFEQAYAGTSVDGLTFGSGDGACQAASVSQTKGDLNFYWGSESLDEAATADSTSVYFSVFDCGTTAEMVQDGGQTVQEFTTTVRGNYRQLGFMLMAPSLSSTEISCRYKQNDSGIGIKISAAIDTSVDAPNRVTQNSEIGQVSTDLVSYKILVDGEEYVDSNEITLGSTVSLQFDSIGHVTNGFHIRSCLATNEVESETAANYESLSLISNSCPVTSGHSALETINPQVSDNTLTYNQFAFLDDTDQLLFGLECVLEFGDQPSCAEDNSRRFLPSEASEVTVRIPIVAQKSTTTSSYLPLASSIAFGSVFYLV